MIACCNCIMTPINATHTHTHTYNYTQTCTAHIYRQTPNTNSHTYTPPHTHAHTPSHKVRGNQRWAHPSGKRPHSQCLRGNPWRSHIRWHWTTSHWRVAWKGTHSRRRTYKWEWETETRQVCTYTTHKLTEQDRSPQVSTSLTLVHPAMWLRTGAHMRGSDLKFALLQNLIIYKEYYLLVSESTLTS